MVAVASCSGGAISGTDFMLLMSVCKLLTPTVSLDPYLPPSNSVVFLSEPLLKGKNKK